LNFWTLDQELISYQYLSWDKNPTAPSFWGEIWQELFLKLMRIDLRSRIFDLTSHLKDGRIEVILRIKVLPPGE